jgi:hypothetical protein
MDWSFDGFFVVGGFKLFCFVGGEENGCAESDDIRVLHRRVFMGGRRSVVGRWGDGAWWSEGNLRSGDATTPDVARLSWNAGARWF